MNTMLYLASCLFFTGQIDLIKLQIFEPRQLYFHALGENMLICSSLEQQLVLISPTGELIARYDRKGQDPYGLSREARVLGFIGKHIYVRTNSTNVFSFTHALTPLKSTKAFPFSHHFGGTSVGQETLLVKTRGDYAFREMKLNDNEWQVQKELFPTQMGGERYPTLTPIATYFDGVISTYDHHPDQRNEFEVKFYRYRQGQEPELFAVVDDEVEPRKHAKTETFIDATFFYQNKLLVLLTNFNLQRNEIEKQWLAVFGLDGKPLKRKYFNEASRLYPLHGGQKLYILDEDTMMLEHFSK